VLEFSRVQQSRQYEFESVDLAALVRETVDAFAQGLPGPQGVFRVESCEAAPVVHADPAAIEQVIVNLLDNAVKYSDGVRRSPCESRAIARGPPSRSRTAASGLPRTIRRISSSASTAVPESSHRRGFGLGLPIVRELVRAHGGTVDVSSTPGVGSIFRVTLPRLNQRPAPATTSEPAAAHPPVSKTTASEAAS
jgi:two-component system sensor histidine kinase ChiS